LQRRGPRVKPQKVEDKTRVNERIRVPEVRVVGADGEQVGVISTGKARALAEEAGLDLVEVSPNAKPPVCKIMDYGKYKFDIAKKAKQAKAKQHTVKLKEIKLHPKTDTNDYSYRLKHAIEFLEKGCKVKISMIFRGREMAHLDYGRRLLEKMQGELKEHGDMELAAKLEGNSMVSIFAPFKDPVAAKKRIEKQKREAEEEALAKAARAEEAV
jgi:translation initiation factor IF-3